MGRALWARRPTVAGALVLAYMLMMTGSALAAGVPVGMARPPFALAQTPCDTSTTICISVDWPLTFLKSLQDNAGKIMEAVGIIVALLSLGYGVRGKGWGKAGAGVLSGVVIAALAANIAAGGVTKQITGQ